MKRKIITRATIGTIAGIALGHIITVLISLTSGNGSFVICTPDFIELIGNEAIAAALQTLLCAVMGSGFSVASVIWEMDELNIATQSGICFGIYAVILLPIAYITSWMEHSLAGVLTYIGIFAASFVIVWAIQYLLWKNKVRAINEKLNS